ncbi:MAG TPA: UbiX family flavin prenyltransferase [Holophaga sp.]|nr:UbiX family flavin prenyltransferase [Holophaga sp.]
MARHLVLAMTGATGTRFGVAVLDRLAASGEVARIELLLSPTGRRCLQDECGLDEAGLAARSPRIRLLDAGDLGTGISSGSHPHDGMVVIPCSAGTLGRIASGTSDNLVCRAADVCLKERRPLVLCLRETPLNRIHLENMLRVHDAGAVVMPLAPGFYHRPQTLDDLADAFATRVLDQLGIRETDPRRWQAT